MPDPKPDPLEQARRFVHHGRTSLVGLFHEVETLHADLAAALAENERLKRRLRWHPMEDCPHFPHEIVNYPSFFTSGPHVCVAHEHDEGPAVRLALCRRTDDEWQEIAWWPLVEPVRETD
jgi:hypothetical protein